MFLVFDTETTGLPKNNSAPVSDLDNWPRLVQIAWQLHGQDGSLLDYKDYIITPEGFDIPYQAAAIHGITTQMAQQHGVPLAQVLEELKRVLDATKVGVGHNLRFDYNILGAEFLRSGQRDPFEDLPIADTMELGTQYCALPSGRPGKFKSPKLEELYHRLFGKGFSEAHNAAADVNATAQVFFELLRVGAVHAEEVFWNAQDLQNFIRVHPDPIMPFPVKIRNQVRKLGGERTIHTQNAQIDLGSYFPFHNHSIYSALQASSHIQDLIKHAQENQFPAVGMVDLGNLMGAFKFLSEVAKFNKAQSSNGDLHGRPQPLVGVLGCEFYLSERPEQKQFTKDDPDRRTNAVLLAKSFAGYKNLAKLSSLGYLEGFYFGVPRISKQMLLEHKEGLIALSGGIACDIPHTLLEYGEQKAEQLFVWWQTHFGADFYVQVQNHGLKEEAYINGVLIAWANKYGVKILAQNETFYRSKEDSHIQDILLCIKDGEKLSAPVGRGFGKRRQLPSTEYYLKNREEISVSFQQYPQAFEAYQEFFDKFEPYTLERNVLLPQFDIPQEFQDPQDLQDDGKRGENAYLRHLTYKGAEAKYGAITPEIRERLDFELQVIAKTGYPGYFLIVQDFCNQAREMGVWVGPGRGSAAGSAVAYCTGITNVDPIKYDLLFERFLNPERVSMPDIDIDFDDEGRDEVIKWVVEKYGKKNVAQIITYSVLGGKSAIKDAGRVLDVSIPETNAIAKLVPATPGMNIGKALSKFDKLAPEDQSLVTEMKSILDNEQDQRHAVLSAAQKMEGAIRNTGIHACGVIITPEDISNLVPVTIASKDADIIVSQFDNSVAENAGLLKMDFLGLRTLTIIKDAIKLVKANHGIVIDPDKIPLDDEKTYKLFQEGRTVGIFQYESPGMQKYMRELKPSVFADLIAMNALYRPGPIKYIPNFINRKHGVEEIIYDLPETEEYLAETYGITVYQEQVMLLSQKLANFTKGEADTLRKAMGKKLKDVLDTMYPKFLEGGKANNLDPEKLNKIWKDWEAFAAYAFNKSHSTCYALIAYHTAYLKANYPAEYMASAMTHNLNNTKQITMFMEDCKNMGVDVLGPNVNESHYEFAVNSAGQIRFGLGAIKGIGEGASEAIVRTASEGPFTSVYDFFERVPAGFVNKRVVESLVMAGAFDEVDAFHRAQYFEQDISGRTTIERLIRYGQSFQESKNEMEHSLFADFAEEVQIEQPKINSAPHWQNMHALNKEKETIGFYISAHPLDEFRYEFDFLSGNYSRAKVLSDKSEQSELVLPESSLDEGLVDSEMEVMVPEVGQEDEFTVENPFNTVQPRGPMQFLHLDEIDLFRDQNYGPEQIQLFEQIQDYREKQKFNSSAKEYAVAGLITEFTVRDGRISGEKEAFLTLEDYSASYSFRLGDRDYLRLRDKIDLQRFVIIKIKFSIAKSGRVFVNITEVCDLKEAFEKFARKLCVVVDADVVKESQILSLKERIFQYPGENKLHIHLKSATLEKDVELKASQVGVHITRDLLQVIGENSSIEFFIN